MRQLIFGAACVAVLGTSMAALAGGCASPVAILNSHLGGEEAGGFDLSGTPFAGKGTPGPAIRFWAWNNFQKANSGEQDQYVKDTTWLLNPAVDARVKDYSPNVFSLFQANWMGPKLSGCGFDLPEKRTVVELSFADADKEGQVGHRGFYAVASVKYSETLSSFDFDDVRGAAGKAGNVVPVQAIPVPRVVGAGRPLAGGKLAVNLELESPVSYSEGGKDAPVKLIAGYRIVYAEGAEPTSSDPAKWGRAFDLASPAKELGTVKPGAVSVAVPAGKPVWLAAQIVYSDPSAVTSRATSAHVAAPAAGPAGAAEPAPGGRERGAKRKK